MTMVLLIGLLSLLFLVFAIIFLVLIFWSLLERKSPFVSVPKKLLPEIVKALELKEGSVVYDLGCGDGRVLLACYKECPNARYVGVDKNIVPYLFAKINLWFGKVSNIKILRKNFFNCSFCDATHIFTYLSFEHMDGLFPILEKELRPGARLVSSDFFFKNKKPIDIIDLKRPENSIVRKLYIYQF